MKKKHPTEHWNCWNADKYEKRRLREIYNELIALGATHKQIETIFYCGKRAGSQDEQWSQGLYDE